MKDTLRDSLNDSSWIDRLLWVVLGLRTAPKEDLHSLSAELVYGQPLRLPGEFVPNIPAPGHWQGFCSCPHLASRSSMVQHSCESAVSRLHFHVPGLLQLPYDRPFHVLEPGDKHFVVDISGKLERISVDCLKPAHLDLDRPVDLAQLPWQGRLSARPPPPQATPGASPTPTLPPCHLMVLKTPGDTPAPAPVHWSCSSQAIHPKWNQ